MEGEDLSPADAMTRMMFGFWVSRALYVAAELGLADLTGETPRPVAELAEASGSHAPSLFRLLRALASVGVFKEVGPGHFAATALSDTLRSDAPGSLRATAISELGRVHYRAWSHVLDSVKTGQVAFDQAFGMPVFDYFPKHPEDARAFNDSMTHLTERIEGAVAKAYDFSPFARIVDVGGGHGGLLASILKANPRASGVIFEMPPVIEGTKARLETESLSGRCEAIGGDFFEAVPPGGDL